jgi:hypothetical protein
VAFRVARVIEVREVLRARLSSVGSGRGRADPRGNRKAAPAATTSPLMVSQAGLRRDGVRTS